MSMQSSVKRRKILRGIGCVVVAALLCLPLAVWAEVFAVEHWFFRGTPGLALSAKLFPQGQSQSLSTLRKSIILEVSVDAGVFFVVICAALFSACKFRDRLRRR